MLLSIGAASDRLRFTCFLGLAPGHIDRDVEMNTLELRPRLLKTTGIKAHEELNIHRGCTLLGHGRLRFDATVYYDAAIDLFSRTTEASQ